LFYAGCQLLHRVLSSIIYNKLIIGIHCIQSVLFRKL